jgi:lycopene cyclase CruA
MSELAAARARHPRTFEAFAACDEGEQLFERLVAIDRRFSAPQKSAIAVDREGPDRAEADVDVLIAGGGLSLLHAPLLAARGLSVAVVDRARIGQVHRGWNASLGELGALERGGLVPPGDLSRFIEAKYADGFCRWFGGGTYRVREVLDCAVDAPRLLAHTRGLAETRGVRLLDGRAFTRLSLGTGAVEATLDDGTRIVARLLIDATGAASPFSKPDLLCPTVGGALRGLSIGDAPDEYRPDVGEILVTTEGVEDGHQHIWEGFPGRDSLTAYLFYYAEPHELPPTPLADLFERFFTIRARYKRGNAEMVRPTFGVIPGHTRLAPRRVSPADRVLMVGDAAARHSPLTFCGFGSMLRTFGPTCEAVARTFERGAFDSASLEAASREPPMLSLLGALALMLTARGVRATHGEVNELLDAAFATLAELGEERFARFLRDEGQPLDVVRFLAATSRRRPAVYREVWSSLGPRTLGRWMSNVWTSMRAADGR